MIRSTTAEWGWPAKLLHWLGAAFILVLLVHGWWMTHLAARPDRLANYGWHAAIGYDLMGSTLNMYHGACKRILRLLIYDASEKGDIIVLCKD